MTIEFGRVIEVISAMERSNLEELEIFRDGVRIRAIRETAPYAAASPPGKSAAAPAASGDRPARIDLKSPKVGIFQRRKNPATGEPYLPGDNVDEGEVLGTVNVLNVSYDVPAPAKGGIVSVLVDNGLAVEYGQLLFELERR